MSVAAALPMCAAPRAAPQDKMVHWLLAVAMFLGAAGVFGEMLARRSAVVGMGKSLALLLQGAWLVKVAAIEFEGEPSQGGGWGGVGWGEGSGVGRPGGGWVGGWGRGV